MLENYDRLHEFAALSRPQGFQSEVNIDPEAINREQWREKGPDSREESDFVWKSRISSIPYAFQGGPPSGAEVTRRGNTLRSGDC